MSKLERASGSQSRTLRQRIGSVLFVAAMILPMLVGCSNAFTPSDDNRPSFHILTGTENRILFDDPNSDEPTIMERFAQQEGIEFEPTYQGSVDTMIDLQNGAAQYDAVWPASSIWLDLGDTQRAVTRTESIMGTPVVFGIKKSKAEELGWIGTDVTVDDILNASESGKLDFMMSSATQSNSGAMAYLGYLYAFAGHPDVLTSDMLHDPEVVDKLTRILGSVDRTAGASGFLRDLFLDNYADYDAMVNNESAIITANQRLIERGETDVLYVIYPVDGLAVADWPLGYVDHGNADRSALFDRLQTYLKSPDVQHELVAQGRRTTNLGLTMDQADIDPAVFNSDWGIDVSRELVPIQLPASAVIVEALDLYQTTFRKPSYVVFCLDFSLSMMGSGERDLTAAMTSLLDPEKAKDYFLQRTARDVTIVLPFSGGVEPPHIVEGNDPEKLKWLQKKVKDEGPGGGTNIYGCLNRALDLVANVSEDYSAAIVLMTDGKSNRGSFSDFQKHLPQDPALIVPVYSIQFGHASRGQLDDIAEATNGAVYDGRDGLVKAMRDAFGNA